MEPHETGHKPWELDPDGEFVVVYDGTTPDQVDLYLESEGKRVFARSLNTEPIERFRLIIGGWSIDRKVVDRRTKQLPALP